LPQTSGMGKMTEEYNQYDSEDDFRSSRNTVRDHNKADKIEDKKRVLVFHNII
jgi:hypothetical protein